ncbi:MAG: hypothetical protein GF349_02435 [Candidatus Magasanikbacteria bacterium]|nr:hypothetical protein [Candidatus Magasanikbacteria bacterium]
MSETPFKPPGSPEFSAPTAHTQKPEAPKKESTEEYEHPMDTKLKDAQAEEKRKSNLIEKLKERLGFTKKPEKNNEEDYIELTNTKTGEVHKAEIVKEENGKDKIA